MGRKWPAHQSTLVSTRVSGAVRVFLRQSGPGAGRGSGPRLPTLAGMWLMPLQMVVTPERASWRTLVLRGAMPNSWPLITPDTPPRLPRGSPVRREGDGSDFIHLHALSMSRYCHPLQGTGTEAQRAQVARPRPHSSRVTDSMPGGVLALRDREAFWSRPALARG